MKISQYLYESVKDIWEDCCNYPFVQGIGHGNLDIDKFRYYTIQDYLYLLDYVKVFALGIVKANDEETMREFSNMVNDILNNEMSIHNGYMKELNITKEELKNSKPSLPNLSYTSYMLAVATTGSLLEIAVAVLSCGWSYQVIAQRLSEIPGAIEHKFYGNWIKGYTSEEYKNTVTWNINLLDKITENASQQQIEKLKEIFIATSKYEYEFWNMAYNKEK